MYLCCCKNITEQLHNYRYAVRNTCGEMVITDRTAVLYVTYSFCLLIDFPNYDTCFESGFSEDSSHSTFLCEFLYKVSSNTAKVLTEKKLKEGISLLLYAFE